MHVRDAMTEQPACCTPDTSLQEVAQMMEQHDCGCIPVVEDDQSKKLVGVVTDRDIALRGVARGKNPQEMTAGDCMTREVVTTKPDDTVEDCCRTMEENQVRRVPVVDEAGSCCGMMSQADIATKKGEKETGGVVRKVSRPTRTASNAHL